jgi:hypothetical protein
MCGLQSSCEHTLSINLYRVVQVARQYSATGHEELFRALKTLGKRHMALIFPQRSTLEHLVQTQRVYLLVGY